MDWEEPSTLANLLFSIYRGIPFVYEMRTVLDWAITPTTLSVYEWLKFEDIYAELYAVKCKINGDHATVRNVGDPQVQLSYYPKTL